MHQPDSRTQINFDAKALETKDSDNFNSHGKSVESALKKPRQANGW